MSSECRPGAPLLPQSTALGRRAGLLLLAIGVWGPSCSDGGHPAAIGGAGSGTTPIAGMCDSPAEGCDCGAVGQETECHEMVRRVGDYVICAAGVLSCGDDGTWGACNHGELSEKYAPRGQLRALGYGTPQDCENPCDPECTEVEDTPEDLPEDTDVDVTDDGITLLQFAGAGASSSCTGLEITPDPATLTVTSLYPLSPNTIDFTANLTPAGCYSGEPTVLWGINPYDVATIDTNGTVTLATPIAGPITVSAFAGSFSDTVTLNVVVDVTEMPASPTAAQTALQATNASGSAESLVPLYPYANTMFPLGLLPPLIQWRPTTAASAVKVTLRYPSTGTPIFRWARVQAENETLVLNPGDGGNISLAGAPRFTIPTAPADPWFAFEQTVNRNRDDYTDGDTGQYVIQRYVSGARRAEVATNIKFASGQMKGTVYYQSYGTNLVENWGSAFANQELPNGNRFGAATLKLRPGDTYPTAVAGYSSASNVGCRVCHSVSSDGSVMVTNLHSSEASGEPGSTRSSRFLLTGAAVDAANGGTQFTTPSPNNGRYSFPAIFPTGGFFFSNAGPSRDFRGTAVPGGLDGSYDGADSQLYSLATGSMGSTVASTGLPSGLRAATPVFSHDGTRVAFNFYAGTSGAMTGDKHALAVMNFNNAASPKAFSNFTRLTNPVAAGQCSTTSFGGIVSTDSCLDVWPSFFPDNAGIAFEREVFNNGRVAITNSALNSNGTANPRQYIDFGGSRAGCSGTEISSHCGNQGTRAELWWVTLSGVAAKLTNANTGWASGAVLTHTGDGDGVCEAGEQCMEYNDAAGGDDDWICETGETCAEFNYLCQERNASAGGNDNIICEPGETCADSSGNSWTPGEVCKKISDLCQERNSAAGGDNDYLCETGETCQEDNAAPGGDNDGIHEAGETCVKAADNDGVCETGEVCAEAPTAHTATDEPLLNYEPSVNPQAVGGYYWMAFTSRRMFGNVATMNPWWSDPRDRPLGGEWGPTTKKIWISAIDENPAEGSDPSHPPFYLPGQEYLGTNSKAFWVLDECIEPSATRSTATRCDSNLDCCSGECVLDPSSVASGNTTRNCMPAAGSGCIDDNSATQCTTDAQCCNYPDSVCASGVCQPPPTVLLYSPGHFERTFVAECSQDQHPVWELFQWQADVPVGTWIDFTAASAVDFDTLDDIDLDDYVDIGTADSSDVAQMDGWKDDGDNITDALLVGGMPSATYLRVDMYLNPSMDQLSAPTLTNWRVLYTCVDAE